MLMNKIFTLMDIQSEYQCLTQKNQKVKAYYKFHTDVRLGKARKTRLDRFFV